MTLFITFEGGEGSGKSVQARTLHRRLTRRTIPALLTQEPGGTALGQQLANLLKWARDTGISPLTESLMFNASRVQLMTEVIRPNLQAGNLVICDRYTDSTNAYQGYGRRLDLEVVKMINSTTTRKLIPNLTILLDIPPEEGFDRVKSRNIQKDRFENENIAFHRRIREGYLKMAASEPERWLVVDARQPKAKIAQIIWQRVSRLLSTQGTGSG